MARELGGGCKAQLIAAAAAVPFCLAGGALMQYVSFDYLWWVLTAYFVVRLLSSGDPRWWFAIGSATGMGLLTKYSILVLAFGVAGGLTSLAVGNPIPFIPWIAAGFIAMQSPQAKPVVNDISKSLKSKVDKNKVVITAKLSGDAIGKAAGSDD